ncbi:Protein of unknown function (DUF1308) [Teratosphaeria destructans]|uniref:DUF1308 domain-containing protein n=1 Tax=Teratosphaeria destructans TaxID=418781 RepID=A0A9W7W561_9PEZI|nr:Protein of unknown function (DUF1308) [Teratosphaeria destructans]
MAQDEWTSTGQTDSEDQEYLSTVLEDLIARANIILREIDALCAHLQRLRQDGKVDIASFRSNVKSELNMLTRLQSRPGGESRSHVARSSNLPFLERIWITVKKSKGVVSIGKRIYPDSEVKSLSQNMRRINIARTDHNTAGLKKGIIVDAVLDEGKTWVKVSLITNQRLLFDLAKQGWVSDGSDSDFDGDGDDGQSDPDPDSSHDVPLVRTARALARAAKCFRVRTRIPQAVLILPRVREGETAEIDSMLQTCRAFGTTLMCGDDGEKAPTIEEALPSIAPSPLDSLSHVLNIDCTVLLAIVSDFSHGKVTEQPWFHSGLRLQVELEDKENLLPSLLYPVLTGHPLVCTKEAAKRMREIVETIGTASEKARTAVLFGDSTSKSPPELVQEMQGWSAYDVPSDLQLPIKVIDQNENDCLSRLPSQVVNANKGITGFSPINNSVFLYGWASGCTTITSNRSAVTQLHAHLEQFEDLEDDVWPNLWLCPTARSLVGKEKRGVKKGRDGMQAHEDAPEANTHGVDHDQAA